MTNQTIPPCPVCGKVPKWADQQLHLCVVIPRCVCLSAAAIDSATWHERCMYEMHNALYKLGIQTVDQLKARLAPDPRVADAVDTLRLMRNNGHIPKNISKDFGEVIQTLLEVVYTQHLSNSYKLRQIAAQRGEVEK